MNRQRGLALTALIGWGVVISLVAIVGIRLLPEYIDYYKIRKAARAVAAESNGKTVADVRQAFGKYAEVEHIKTIGPADLEVYKDNNQIVVSFAYQRRVPLLANVSLLLDFRGSSSGRGP